MAAAANLQTIRLMSGYRDGPYKPGMAPNGAFETKDGWIQIVVLRDHDFAKLCTVLGQPALARDPRFAAREGRRDNADALFRIVADALLTEPATKWRDAFTEAGLQNELVQTYEEFVHHPHVEETGFIAWLPQPGLETPWPVPNIPGLPRLDPDAPNDIAPRLGQHTREILAELGYDAAGIDTLAKDGVIGL
jgi:crotonobetainyl-CoA:carnitine CoA-transferase CaiB-like acyl-CoA transferase